MKKILVLALIAPVIGWAQVKVSPHSKLMFQKSSFGFVSELPPPPPGTVGSSYYSEEWQLADVFLKSQTKLENIRLKLDLARQSFEILHEGSVKMLPGESVLSFQWVRPNGDQEAFIKGNHITVDGLKITGFLKLITDSEPYKLVEFPTTETLSANYNPALDVGTRDNQIVKKTKLFIVKDNLMLEVKGSKKKLINDFKEIFQTDVSGIIKEFSIDTRDNKELAILLNQLNFSNPG